MAEETLGACLALPVRDTQLWVCDETRPWGAQVACTEAEAAKEREGTLVSGRTAYLFLLAEKLEKGTGMNWKQKPIALGENQFEGWGLGCEVFWLRTRQTCGPGSF